MSKEVLAAGTVCWRRVPRGDGGSGVMVLLIHRTKQRDVSFPKGKLDPGESMPQAAIRETWEETGLRVSLGVHLGTIQYEIGPQSSKTARSSKTAQSSKTTQSTKTVQYWAAEVSPQAALASTFTPNSEVQALEWVPLEEARKRLSYKADRELYDVFLRLAAVDLIDTFSITLLRHAKAEPRSAGFPIDHLRPLCPAGDEQAETLVSILQAFGPKRIYTSTAVRCIHTVEPLAERLERRVRQKEALSQDFWDAGDLSDLRKFAGKITSRGKNTVVCTHRPVLPDLVRELVLATGSVPGNYLEVAAALPPAGFSVFHFSRTRPGAGILGVETYPLKH